MIDWITIGIFFGLFMGGVIAGIAVGFPIGQRHILDQVQRRTDEERRAYLDQVKIRADQRLARAAGKPLFNGRQYGVLDAKEIS